MRRRIKWASALAVLAGIAALLVWWRCSVQDADEGASASVDESAIVRDKLRARQSGSPDVVPASLGGRVTAAADGTPVAGALVLLSPKTLDDGVRTSPGERAVPLYVKSDGDGRYALADVPAGRYSISASADGFLPARRLDVVLAPGRDETGLDLELARGGHRVSGVVKDIGGGAVEGALVRATRLDEGSMLAFFSRAPTATMADAEGRYALWLPDGSYAMTASHEDYVEGSAMLSVDGGPRTRDFSLTPGAVIEGRVVTREGTPVGSAYVRWENADSGMFGGSGSQAQLGLTGLTSVVTDDAGRFRIGGLSSGVMSLSAVADRFATRQPVEVPLGVAEQVSGIDLVVDTAYKISGFVVARGDETTGLSGVMLGAYSMRPASFNVARGPSESDGYFEILGVQPGSYTIGALGEEALPKLMGETATITDADVTDVLVVLDPGVHIRGRVEPGVAATITLEIDPGEMGFFNMMSSIGNGFVRGRSGDDGAFDLAPVAPGKLTVVARADDGREGRAEVDVGSDGIEDVVVKLEDRARIAGRVVDANGKPVEGVEVSLVPTERKPGGMTMSFGARGFGSGGGATGTTAEDGTYTVRGLAAGEYRVSVIPGTGPALYWAQPADPDTPAEPIAITLAHAEQREGLDLAVEARDGTITGTVVDEDGGPVADAWVRPYREQSSDEFFAQIRQQFPTPETRSAKEKPAAEPAGERIARRAMRGIFAEPPVLADATGRFEITGLREGTYTLVADAPRGEGRGTVTGIAIGASAKIEVLALGGLRGVLKKGSVPVREYTIVLDGASDRRRRVSDDAGRFAIDRLDAGEYDVRAEADGGIATAKVTIAEGATAEVNLALEGFATLRGRVVDAGTGEGIGGLTIVAKGRAVDPGAMLEMVAGKGARTGSDGKFEIDRIEPGKGEVQFMDPDAGGFSVVASAPYEVDPDADHDLGTITGMRASDIPTEERGELGLHTRVATFADRPIAPDAEDAEDAAPDADATRRLWVQSVTVGGAASAEGVEPGDEIVAVRNVGVEGLGVDNAQRSLTAAHVRAGESVALELRREGTTRRVTLVAIAREKK